MAARRRQRWLDEGSGGWATFRRAAQKQWIGCARAMDWLHERGSGQAWLWGGRAMGEETEKVAIKKWLRAG